ncbi:MAG: hypothetical protein FWD23_15885 [Oscillospiraceae bacterium]|nr:hypothetical protein [Oscillospiraceae bacterium]
MTIAEAIFALDRRASVIYTDSYGEYGGCIITGIITRSVEKRVFALEIAKPDYAGQVRSVIVTGLDSVKLRR